MPVNDTCPHSGRPRDDRMMRTASGLSLTCAFALLALTLCGAQAQAQRIAAPARRALRHASVRCDDAARCPAAVGMVATLWERFDPGADALIHHVNRCTGTLVAANLVLTNRHCLPPEILQDRESAAPRVVVTFPASGEQPAETLRVAAIATLSAEPAIPYLHVSDYALLRLARRSRRTPMSTTSAGPVMGATYAVFSITPVGSGILANEGLLVVSTVEAIDHAPHQPSFAAWPLLFGIDHASIRIGHSGSPVVDAANAIVGLIYGVPFPPSMSATAAATVTFEQGYAMNLACIRLPGVASGDAQQPAGCSNYGAEDVLTLRGLAGE